MMKSDYRQSSRPHGLTLLEAMISLTLVLMITGIITNIVGRWSHLLRFSDDRLERIEIVSTALSSIRGEVEGALTVVPAASSLTLTQISPTYVFPHPVYPSPVGWDWTHMPTDTIDFVLDSASGKNMLYRRVSSGPSRLMAEDIAGFSAASLPNGNIKITISLEQDRALHTFSAEAWRP